MSNFATFLESSEHSLSPLPPSFFPYFKYSCRKIHLKVSRFLQNPSLTCDVITTSLKSHVSYLIHLITLFEAIPIDFYLDQVSILYGCLDIVAQSMHTFCYTCIYLSYLVPHFTNFTKNTLKTRNFEYP